MGHQTSRDIYIFKIKTFKKWFLKYFLNIHINNVNLNLTTTNFFLKILTCVSLVETGRNDVITLNGRGQILCDNST